ncbi:transcription factor ETV7-like [Patiria miniata]|uniref:PNT domain-containing protein n=1 Tax=Patiria miniata TaxID=46514 RepID=A0A913ZSZ3_PATMI|nr:transcription factor ETV7-like [Patiria miniata]
MSNKICSPVDSCDNHQPVDAQNYLDKVVDLTIRQKYQQLDMQENRNTLRVSNNDPRLWKRTDVASWLQWAVEFYQLDSVDTLKFAMNGRGLCLLTRSGFMTRAPSCGDILHSDFQRRYAVAVLKSKKEKMKRSVPWQPDANKSMDDTKRPRGAEKQ